MGAGHRLLAWSLLIAAASVSASACSDDEASGSMDASDVAVDADAASDATEPADSALDTGPSGPDPAFVHVMQGQTLTSPAEAFVSDLPRQYRTAEEIAELDVRGLVEVDGAIVAAGAADLHVYDAGTDTFAAVGLTAGSDILGLGDAPTAGGEVIVLRADAVDLVETTGAVVTSVPVADGAPTAATALGGRILVAAGGTVWELSGEALVAVPGAPAEGVEDVALDDAGAAWLATAEGVRRLDLGSGELGSAVGPSGAHRVARATVGASEVWTSGERWVMRDVAGAQLVSETGQGGLPTSGATALSVGAERVALGHTVGGSALERVSDGALAHGKVDHYVAGRWLPASGVTAALVDSAGRVWLGTPSGLTRITWESRTLAESAAELEQVLDDHFWRMDGFVASGARLDDAWEPTTWSLGDSDNDGLWTQMQVAAWCYGYAATGDEALYAKARKAMEVMMLQVDIPAGDFEAAGLGRGFVTRSLVRDDEGAVFEDKAARDNWHLVTWEGRDYYWKDDTSSDETTGHFYGYPLYFDLCAKDESERAEVAERAGALADYILRHGYELLDLDGEKTTHGHWNPERLAAAVDGLDVCIKNAGGDTPALEECFDSYGGGGWLNSIEIMGHMLAAWHMTGEARFYEAYEELIEVHRYDEVATPHEFTVTITQPPTMNHSDHELAMLAYHTLIRYEPNDDRRQLWINGMLFLMEHEVGERNPLWGAFTTLLAGDGHVDTAAAVQSLREMPVDRREFPTDNAHREDAGTWPPDRFDKPQFDRVFPYDEIRTAWWNGNFYVKSEGGSPKSVSGPMAWLLPYYAFRYAGVIAEP